MTTHALNYGSTSTRHRWRTVAKVLLTVLLTAAVLSLPFVGVMQTRLRVDAVTGSVERQTTWPLGIATGPRIDVSPLEQRLIATGTTWTRDWRVLTYREQNVFGGATSRACASAPPIYSFRSGLEDFVAASSDHEIRQFVRVIATGTEAEQSAAIEAAADAASGHLRTSP